MFSSLFRSQNPRWQYRLFEGEPGTGGGGGGDPAVGDPAAPKAVDWYGGLPEDVRNDAAIAALKDKPVGDVVTGYRDLSKKVAESAPPAKPADYGIALPAALSELAKDPKVAPQLQATLDGLLARAHALGMPKAMAQAFVDEEAKLSLADLETARKERADAEKALKTKWGEQYDEKVAFTKRAMEVLDPKLKAKIEKAGLGSDPGFIELVNTIGEAQAEGRLIKGGAPGKTKDLATRLYGGTAAT